MLRRICVFLLLQALILSLLPISALAGNGYEDYLVTRALEQQESVNNSRWVSVPGRGQTLYYAQTNPFWAKMRYETAGSTTYRRFGESGCCPTSVAIAIANLVPMEDLGKLRPYASGKANGYGISTGIMNPLNMQKRDGIYWLNSAEDYQKYLPLIFGQYAAGNNQKRSNWRVKSSKVEGSTGGTSIGFLVELCAVYGLTYNKLTGKGNLEWMEPVRCGAVAVALANSQHHPFANGPGHYIAIVGCDDEYLYIMDPQNKAKADYTLDRNNVLDVMDNGFIRVRHENFYYLHIANVYVVSNAEVDAKLEMLEVDAMAKAQ